MGCSRHPGAPDRELPGPHAGGHYAKIVCSICAAFVKWAPKPDADKAKRPAAHRELVTRYGGSVCAMCGRKAAALILPDVLEAHHIAEYADGGTDDEANIVILCTACHKFAHWLRTYMFRGHDA